MGRRRGSKKSLTAAALAHSWQCADLGPPGSLHNSFHLHHFLFVCIPFYGRSSEIEIREKWKIFLRDSEQKGRAQVFAGEMVVVTTINVSCSALKYFLEETGGKIRKKWGRGLCGGNLTLHVCTTHIIDHRSLLAGFVSRLHWLIFVLSDKPLSFLNIILILIPCLFLSSCPIKQTIRVF